MAVSYHQPSGTAGEYDYGWNSNTPQMYLGVHFILDSYYVNNRTNRVTAEVYLAALLRAVELRFMDLQFLRIHLTLVGITYPTPVKEEVFMLPDGAYIEPTKTINRLAYYPYYLVDFNNSKADIIFALTGREIHDPYKEEEEEFLITGSAMHAAVCGPYRIGIGEDDGWTFSGVVTVAQQIARLLGAPSDGRRPCRKEDGYLMSNNYGKTKHYNLSKCSREWLLFHYYASTGKSWACWNDKPSPLIEDKKYPSEVMDVCEARHSRTRVVQTCSHLYNRQQLALCREVCCVDYPETTEAFITVAFDGAHCGTNGVCISGQCIQRQ